MRLPKFRVRTLMIAVAFVAMGCGRLALDRLSRHYREMARYHMVEIRYLTGGGLVFVGRGRPPVPKDDERAPRGGRYFYQDLRSFEQEEEKRQSARLAFHKRMLRKYERAARYPWLRVGPDPPEPK